MDTPKKIMDTASPVAQDKQGRVLELGRGSSPISELQSPASGSPQGVTGADTAVASSSPLGTTEEGNVVASSSSFGATEEGNVVASSSSLGATVSSCTQHDVLEVDSDMVMNSGTDPSSGGGPSSSQQQSGAGSFGTTGLTKNKRRKLRKMLQKQKFKAAAAGHSNVTKRSLPESSVPSPSMHKKVRKDIQPRKNVQPVVDIQPWKDVQPVEDVQPWKDVQLRKERWIPMENVHPQKYVRNWENIHHVKNVQLQQYVQPWENVHPEKNVPQKYAQPLEKYHSEEDIHPQKCAQPWENIHPIQPQQYIQPWENIHPVKDVQPWKKIHPAEDVQPWKNIHPVQDIQTQRDVRPQRDLKTQKEVQPQKHVQPNPCIKMIIVKMNFPSDRLSAAEAESIQREILMLTDSIRIGARLPKILAINLVKGALNIQCGDTATAEWIRINFSNNSRVLGDAALRVLNADELPKPVKVAFKTKEKFSDHDAFLRRLQRLNPGLKTSEWRVLTCTVVSNVARYILEVNSADLEAIHRADFGAFTGLDRGVFKILHDPKRREPLELEHTAPTVPSASATTSAGRQGLY